MKRFFKYSAMAAIVILCAVCAGFFTSETVTVAENAVAEYGSCENHIYKNNGEYTVIGEATCISTATMHRECVVCGELDIFTTPRNPENHKIISGWNYSPKPTCSASGERYKVCYDCNKIVVQEEVPAEPDAHVAGKTDVVVAEATCKTEGKKASECKYCSVLFDFRAIPVNAENHVVTDKWTVVLLPTCNEKGSLSGECDLCGKAVEVRELAPTGAHTPGEEWFVDAEPTCVSDGSKSQHCTVCEEPCNTVVIPATPDLHTYQDEYTTDVPATCISTGQMSMHCIYCDAVTNVYEIDINPTAHSYTDEWIITREPTCNKTGLKHQICTLCGESSVSTMMDTVAHTYPGAYEIIKESADGLSAQVKYICTVCSYEYITIEVFGEPDNDGDMGDKPVSYYPLVPVADTLLKVDYNSGIVSNVKVNMTVGQLMSNFTNSAMFAIYGADNSFISEEDIVTTGVKFNYTAGDKWSTDYVFSVTGDIDADGRISAADARLVLRAAAKIDTLTGAYAAAADVNGDGRILASDARKTLLVAAGIERFESTYGY